MAISQWLKCLVQMLVEQDKITKETGKETWESLNVLPSIKKQAFHDALMALLYLKKNKETYKSFILFLCFNYTYALGLHHILCVYIVVHKHVFISGSKGLYCFLFNSQDNIYGLMGVKWVWAKLHLIICPLPSILYLLALPY